MSNLVASQWDQLVGRCRVAGYLVRTTHTPMITRWPSCVTPPPTRSRSTAHYSVSMAESTEKGQVPGFEHVHVELDWCDRPPVDSPTSTGPRITSRQSTTTTPTSRMMNTSYGPQARQLLRWSGNSGQSSPSGTCATKQAVRLSTPTQPPGHQPPATTNYRSSSSRTGRCPTIHDGSQPTGTGAIELERYPLSGPIYWVKWRRTEPLTAVAAVDRLIA